MSKQLQADKGVLPPLRAWRDPERAVLVKVTDWLAQEPVTEQYFERHANASMLWNYLRRYGPTTVLRKIRSRLAEHGRNAKIAGVGTGVALIAPPGSGLTPGARVLFFTPNAGPSATELPVDVSLVVPGELRLGRNENCQQLRAAIQELKGYSHWSGVALPEGPLKVLRALTEASDAPEGDLSCTTTDRTPGRSRTTKRPTAVIFGLGNYAKTLIIPNIRDQLELACVHEIDPDQLIFLKKSGVTLDTSPYPREGEAYDAWFIAGYHHTHADLAVLALQRGGYAVVEKPLVTTPPQFSALKVALENPNQGRGLFACFQKRYAAFNRHIHADLGVEPGNPIHMSALVYEVPLPRLHWYNWPNSGSRIISNACHWLDFFMWANSYSPVATCSAYSAGTDDVHCVVSLVNGASLLLELTHNGSPRVGVRELIELRSDSATVRITDATLYSAENTHGVVRRMRVNPVAAYATMYRQIAAVIAKGTSADPPESLRSTELMLALEAKLASQRGARKASDISGSPTLGNHMLGSTGQNGDVGGRFHVC